ncbi:hypothetical protein EJB05_50084, partial [Eragrostis curvula]
MADPVASIEKIVKIGLKIKEAVDTVRRNKEVCLEIRKIVLRYSAILSQLQQTGVMNNSPVMSGALEDLAEALEGALELVTVCQERSTISSFISAGDLSKQLGRATDKISARAMVVLCALQAHSTMVFLARQDVNNPMSRQPDDTIVVETSFNRNSTDDDRHFLAITFPTRRKVELNGSQLDLKAVLNDGNVVAVKIFPKDRVNFTMPIIDHVLKLQHKNIVKVLGYCCEYKYQPYVVRLLKHNNNGPVIEKVRSCDTICILVGSQLEWSAVFRIIEGLAQAVHYLHEQHIVHMDVKPSNILLDSDMNPKITDFDLSLVLDADESTAYGIMGTFYFMPPEYLASGIISTSNDVYAFGVTLFETLSCMCRSKQTRENSPCPFSWAWEAWQSGEVEELFNPSLFDSSQLMEIKRCMCIGLLCTQFDRADRPTMKDVIEMLNGDEELPTPKTPKFYSELQDEWPDSYYEPVLFL